MSQSEHRVKIIVTTEDKSSAAAKKAAGAFDELAKAAKLVAAGYALLKSAQGLVSFVKLGAGAERAEQALDGLAAAAGTTGEAIVKAIQSASGFTINSMAAMTTANRALIMEVAKMPEDFERLTTVAVALGRAMGVDAVQSIDNFVTAAGRQSYLIADNLGLIIKVEAAQENYAKTLNKTADQLTDTEKRQAFLNEMLVQGERKLAALGNSAPQAATKIEVLEAGFADLKVEAAKAAAEIVAIYIPEFKTQGLTVVTDKVAELAQHWRILHDWGIALQMGLDSLGDSFKLTLGPLGALINLIRGGPKAYQTYQDAMRQLAAAQIDWNHTSEISRYRQYDVKVATDDASEVLREQADRIDHVSYVSEGYIRQLHLGVEANDAIEKTILDTIQALKDEAQAALDANEAMVSASEKQLGLAMQYTSYQEGVTESAADFAQQRVEIEADHVEKIADIRAKGQTWYKQIDEEGTRLELQIAQARLNELLAKQAAFNADTSELEVARTAQSIRNLQQEIAEHTGTLQAAHNGYLAMKGKNVDDLLAEEDRHYNEALDKLKTSQAEQEAAQKQSLGRMILAHFEAWQEMTFAVGGYTDDQRDFVMAMRLEIAREYGLMTDAGIQAMTDTERVWNAKLHLMKLGILDTKAEVGNLVAGLKDLAQEIRNLPAEKKIQIITQYIHEGSPGANIPTITRQHGGPIRAGQLALIGERGPELFVPGSSGTIINNTQTEQIVGSHNTYNISDPREMLYLGARERAAARNAFARASGMGA